jgi:hypothetical protein
MVSCRGRGVALEELVGMADDVEQARLVLERLVAAIEAGELVATSAELAALRGALVALKGVRDTTV